MEISFDYLASLGEGEKMAVYDVNVNDHIRIIAPYQGKFYSIFWLKISRDGSIYCGIRDLAAKKYSMGTLLSTEKGVSLDWSQLPELTEVDDIGKLRKMSFHNSGKIHSAKYGDVTQRTPFDELETQEELFVALFKEPCEYEPVTTAEKKDICILSIIPKNHPIFLQAHIAPAEKYNHVVINNGHYQYTALLNCTGIDKFGSIIIQLCFSFSDENGYPPYSFLIWPTKKDV